LNNILLGLAAMGRFAGRIALDAVLPATCLTCDVGVDAPGRLCPDCFTRTAFIGEPCCGACGVPFANARQGGRERLCQACRLAPPPWGQARGALRYDAQARRLVLPLKYSDRVELADALAPWMARAGTAMLRAAEVIVPVPLHRRRLFSRRYNQAALLAGALARLTGRPSVPDALRRVRATRSLGELSAPARAQTVAGAFAVRPHRLNRVAGRRVVLVDDVLTSGATCGACTRVLLEAGARSVDVLVAARVPAPGTVEEAEEEDCDELDS
jgi:ComF family protein